MQTDEYKEAFAELKELFQQTPIVRHFDTVE